MALEGKPLFYKSRVEKKYRQGIDSMIDQFGEDCRVVRPGPKLACPNCEFDANSLKSSGEYKSGGPVAFTRGICPVCGGSGYDPVTLHIEDVRKYSIKRNIKPSRVPVGVPVQETATIARLKGWMEDVEPLRDMEFIWLAVENGSPLVEKYTKLSDPENTGSIIPGRYFIMYVQKVPA